MEPDRGRLLVAAPGLPDPNFETTVVLLLEHGVEGTLGVVLNQPSEVGLADALDEWEPYAAEPPVFFVGGPVGQGSILGLARVSGDEPIGVRPLVRDIGLIDLEMGPTALGLEGPVRVFAGYAGWGAGQLELEIEAGTWFILEVRTEDVFGADPESLWRDVLARQGGVFSTITPDPTLN